MTLASLDGIELEGSALPAAGRAPCGRAVQADRPSPPERSRSTAPSWLPAALAGPGRSLEVRATFGADSFQHVGFGVDLDSVAAWAMFSTAGSGGSTLYARTHDGSSAVDVPLGPGLVGSPHVFGIDWTDEGVVFRCRRRGRAHPAGGDRGRTCGRWSATSPPVVPPSAWSGCGPRPTRRAAPSPRGCSTPGAPSTGARSISTRRVRPARRWRSRSARAPPRPRTGAGRRTPWSSPVERCPAPPATSSTGSWRRPRIPTATPVVDRVALAHRPVLPVVSAGAAVVAEGDEGSTTVQVPVRLSAPSAQTVTAGLGDEPRPGADARGGLRGREPGR